MGEEEEQEIPPEEELGEDDDGSKAQKRKERLEQNRISARESRKRKKTMIEELQRTVITLSRENKDLNERNEGLRRQLMEIGTKYPNVVPMQAIVGAPPTTMDQQQQAAAGGAVAPAAPMAMAAFPTIAYPPGMAPGTTPAAYPVVMQQQPQAMQPAAPVAQPQQVAAPVAPAPAEGTK